MDDSDKKEYMQSLPKADQEDWKTTLTSMKGIKERAAPAAAPAPAVPLAPRGPVNYREAMSAGNGTLDDRPYWKQAGAGVYKGLSGLVGGVADVANKVLDATATPAVDAAYDYAAPKMGWTPRDMSQDKPYGEAAGEALKALAGATVGTAGTIGSLGGLQPREQENFDWLDPEQRRRALMGLGKQPGGLPSVEKAAEVATMIGAAPLAHKLWGWDPSGEVARGAVPLDMAAPPGEIARGQRLMLPPGAAQLTGEMGPADAGPTGWRPPSNPFDAGTGPGWATRQRLMLPPGAIQLGGEVGPIENSARVTRAQEASREALSSYPSWEGPLRQTSDPRGPYFTSEPGEAIPVKPEPELLGLEKRPSEPAPLAGAPGIIPPGEPDAFGVTSKEWRVSRQGGVETLAGLRNELSPASLAGAEDLPRAIPENRISSAEALREEPGGEPKKVLPGQSPAEDLQQEATLEELDRKVREHFLSKPTMSSLTGEPPELPGAYVPPPVRPRRQTPLNPDSPPRRRRQ